MMDTESLGLWMLAASSLGLMSIAEFGLKTAIAKFVNSKRIQHNALGISTGLKVHIV